MNWLIKVGKNDTIKCDDMREKKSFLSKNYYFKRYNRKTDFYNFIHNNTACLLK